MKYRQITHFNNMLRWPIVFQILWSWLMYWNNLISIDERRKPRLSDDQDGLEFAYVLDYGTGVSVRLWGSRESLAFNAYRSKTIISWPQCPWMLSIRVLRSTLNLSISFVSSIFLFKFIMSAVDIYHNNFPNTITISDDVLRNNRSIGYSCKIPIWNKSW